jgi:hypothetical protein
MSLSIVRLFQKLAVLGTVVGSLTSYAAGRATVEVGTSKTPPTLIFTTKPANDLAINAEGPWKLEIKSIKGATVEEKEFKRPQWKESIGGFEVPVKLTGGKKIDVEYKMTTFVCTKDKSMCYREVVEGKESVNL